MCHDKFARLKLDIVALQAYIMHRLQVESPFQTISRSARKDNSEDNAIDPFRLSRFLSQVAMTAAVTAICVTYFKFPPVGFEGMIFISSVAVVLALGAGTMSLILAIYLVIRRKSSQSMSPTIVASLAIALALAYVWMM